MEFVPALSNYFILVAILSIMLPLVPLSVNKVQANHINCTNWHGDFDADCDGLSDAWELIDRYTEDGTGINVALPGADPNHKDIYVEIDYMSHHIPPTTAIDLVTAKFDTPAFELYNPDTTYGVRLHYIIDDNVPHRDCIDVFDDIVPDPVLDSYDEYKQNFFGTASERATNPNFYQAKMDVYHYALFIHTRCGDVTSSGKGEVPGNDFVVSLGHSSWGNPDPVSGHATGSNTYKAATFMHELGHNLGLKHAGTTDLPNCKPNYLSVMNYAFQFPTFLTGGNWPMDYSHNVLNSLKESALVESTGIGLAQPSNLKTVVGHTVPPSSHVLPHYLHPNTPPTANNSPINYNWYLGDGDTNDIVNSSITNLHTVSCGDTDVDNTSVGGKLFGYDDVHYNNLIFWSTTVSFQNGTSLNLPASGSEMEATISGKISQIGSASIESLINNSKATLSNKTVGPVDILEDPTLPPCDITVPGCQDSPCDEEDPFCVPNERHNYTNSYTGSNDVGNRSEIKELTSTEVLKMITSKATNLNEYIKSLNETQFVNGTDVQKLKNDLENSLVNATDSVYSLINSSKTDQAMGKLFELRSLVDGRGSNEIIKPPWNVNVLEQVDDLIQALHHRK